MEQFEWKSSYATGSENIDAEHKIFVALINKLISAINSSRDAFYLSRLVVEIQKYAEFHFISEENFMIDIGYPSLSEHQKKHLQLLEKFNIVSNSLELGNETYDSFLTFLGDWFKAHTASEDTNIAIFLKENKR